MADDHRLGPSTRAIVDAARRRRIPVKRLTPTGGLVQLGYGVCQKRIMASQTSDTSAIAVDICQEKPLTNSILRTVGICVPEGRTVKSADEAWEVAQDLGLPVIYMRLSDRQQEGILTIHDARVHVLGRGDRFNLKERRPIAPPPVATV